MYPGEGGGGAHRTAIAAAPPLQHPLPPAAAAEASHAVIPVPRAMQRGALPRIRCGGVPHGPGRGAGGLGGAGGGGRLKGGGSSGCWRLESGFSSRAGGCKTVGGQWGGGARFGHDACSGLLSAAGGAHWPLAKYPCPFLDPLASAGGRAHRPLTPSCPPSPSLAYPHVPTPPPFLSLGGLCQRSPRTAPVPLLRVGSARRRARGGGGGGSSGLGH